MRIDYKWKVMEQEENERELAKQAGLSYKIHVLENGETKRQILQRSKFLLHKPKGKWTPKQELRADVLFKHFPKIEIAYKISNRLRTIYNTKSKMSAHHKFIKWIEIIRKSEVSSYFETVKKSIQNNYRQILNYFNERSTNASAESFNAKDKNFRRQFRGVRDETFFLFRLSKIYA